MDSKITRLIEQASVIVGALPYLQAYRDKTFLIKFGGSAMDDARLVKKLMRDIVLLEVLGFNPVIVHGGGKAISKAMAEAGLEAVLSTGFASRLRKPFPLWNAPFPEPSIPVWFKCSATTAARA